MKNPKSQIQFIFISSLAIVLAWSFSPQVRAQSTIEHSKPSLDTYEARYKVSWKGIQAGDSVHRLERGDDEHSFQFLTRTEPYISMLPFRYYERANFVMEKGHVVPQKYTYYFKEGSRLKKGAVDFNWQNLHVSNTTSHEPWEADLPPGTQDKLTHAFQLRYDLMAGKKDMVYTVAENDEIKPYRFTVLGEENLKTELGEFQTVIVKHQSKSYKYTHMWLAKDLNYIPVKMVHYRKGKRAGGGEIVEYKKI